MTLQEKLDRAETLNQIRKDYSNIEGGDTKYILMLYDELQSLLWKLKENNKIIERGDPYFSWEPDLAGEVDDFLQI